MHINYLKYILCAFIFFINIQFLPAQTETSPVLSKTISLSFNNQSLENIRIYIANQGHIKINYNHDRIPVDQKISVKMENEKISDIPKYLTDLTGSKLKIITGDEIVIIPSNESETPKGRIVGSVVDKDNQRPLPGANIFVEPLQVGTASDNKGNFKLDNLPVGSYVIRATYIGYNTITKPDIIVRSD